MSQNQSSVGQDLKGAAQKGGEAIRAARTIAKTAAAAGSGNWAGAAAEVAKNPKVFLYAILIILSPIILTILCLLSLPSVFFSDDGNDGSYDFTTEIGLQQTYEMVEETVAPIYEAAYAATKIKIQSEAMAEALADGRDGIYPIKYTGAYTAQGVAIDIESLLAMYSVQQESIYEKEIKEAQKTHTEENIDYHPPTLQQGIKKIKEAISDRSTSLFTYQQTSKVVHGVNKGTSEAPNFKYYVEYTYNVVEVDSDTLATGAFGLTETEEDPQITKYHDKSEYLRLLVTGETTEEAMSGLGTGTKPVYLSTRTVVNKYTADSNNKFDFTGITGYPFDSHKIVTSGFGMRIHPILKIKKFHTGVDYSATMGTSIKSVADGVVVAAGWGSSYGNRVIVYHGQSNGQPVVTLYAHMSRISVAVGAKVKAGGELGKVGSTGSSTAPHLHLEVMIGTEYMNPEEYVRE